MICIRRFFSYILNNSNFSDLKPQPFTIATKSTSPPGDTSSLGQAWLIGAELTCLSDVSSKLAKAGLLKGLHSYFCSSLGC